MQAEFKSLQWLNLPRMRQVAEKQTKIQTIKQVIPQEDFLSFSQFSKPHSSHMEMPFT